LSQTREGLLITPRPDGTLGAEWCPLDHFDNTTFELVGPKINQVRSVECLLRLLVCLVVVLK
jgi:hypothetical protein